LFDQLYRLLQQGRWVVHSPYVRRRVGASLRFKGGAIQSQFVCFVQRLDQFVAHFGHRDQSDRSIVVTLIGGS
jgi:hypothetical protein